MILERQDKYLRQFEQRAKRLMLHTMLTLPMANLTSVCESTGLPLNIVGVLAADLARSGWIHLADSSANTEVDHATRYCLTGSAGYCLGVDLGGTKVAAALADFTGCFMAEMTEPTDARGERHVVDQIVSLAKKLSRSAHVDASKIQSVMVGIPGAVDPQSGRISLVPNIKGLADCGVLSLLQNAFGSNVRLDNDVNLAMLAEKTQGSARGYNHAAFLALGTGVGMGLTVDGKVVRGATGAAGEISYLPIGRDTTSFEALRTGAFELEVGSLAIIKRFQAQGGATTATVRDVFGLLSAGDKAAHSVIESTAAAIASAVTALQSILDLEIIVLGGSIGSRPEMVERVQRAMSRVFSRPVHIAASQLGSRAGLIGAVCGALTGLHDHYLGALSDANSVDGGSHALRQP